MVSYNGQDKEGKIKNADTDQLLPEIGQEPGIESGSGFSGDFIPLEGSRYRQTEKSHYDRQEGSGEIDPSFEEMLHEEFLFLTYVHRLDVPLSYHDYDHQQ